MKVAKKTKDYKHEESFGFLIECLEDYAILMMDTKGRIVSWNEGAKKIFGYSKREAIGKSVSFIFSTKDRKLKMPQLEMSTAKDKGRADDERQHVRKDGTLFWATGVMWAIKDKEGNLMGLSKLVRDISVRKQMEDTIRHQSLHDPLTGLPNRRSFEDRFELALSKAKINNQVLATIFLDLDNFKNINDTLGHDTGDILLQEVAARMSEVIRKGDSLCRIGGDEFIIILNDMNKTKDIDLVIKKMQAKIRAPFKISNKKIKMTASLGISFYPQDGKTRRVLEKKADQALYIAKKAGKNRYTLFSDK